jgi:hypothetical protein
MGETFRLFREPYIPSLNLFQHQVSLMTVNGGRFIDYMKPRSWKKHIHEGVK